MHFKQARSQQAWDKGWPSFPKLQRRKLTELAHGCIVNEEHPVAWGTKFTLSNGEVFIITPRGKVLPTG